MKTSVYSEWSIVDGCTQNVVALVGDYSRKELVFF